MGARLLELGVVGCWQGGSEPTGSTLLKRRQLEQLGYTAVSVPYWEWDAGKGKVSDPPPALLFLFFITLDPRVE